VLVDPEVLRTLDEREFRSGLFEALKCGVIRDDKLFALMERDVSNILKWDREAITSIIRAAIEVKAQVVSKDERESGLRRILNYGHTVGHAIEAATGYSRLLHGEAVAWGMIAAAEIARDVRVCSAKTTERIKAAIMAYGPLPPIAAKADEIVSRLAADKKTIFGNLHFVLPEKIGKVKIVSNVPNEVIYRSIGAITNHG
jgi:3-dehydroquinate synthase